MVRYLNIVHGEIENYLLIIDLVLIRLNQPIQNTLIVTNPIHNTHQRLPQTLSGPGQALFQVITQFH
jgi:hypothetical protein